MHHCDRIQIPRLASEGLSQFWQCERSCKGSKECRFIGAEVVLKLAPGLSVNAVGCSVSSSHSPGTGWEIAVMLFKEFFGEEQVIHFCTE